MVRRYFLPLLAVVGVVFAIWTVVTGSRLVPAAPPVAPPSQAPFTSYVAGPGIIEASTQNIAVGTHVSGVVTEIFVKVGDSVKAGDLLFKLDDRALQAELAVRRASLHTQQGQLTKLLRPAQARGDPSGGGQCEGGRGVIGGCAQSTGAGGELAR
jgi:HlyD family secretion protein